MPNNFGITYKVPDTKPTAIYWIGFILFAGLALLLSFIKPSFFWMTIPFIVTFFSKALRLL